MIIVRNFDSLWFGSLTLKNNNLSLAFPTMLKLLNVIFNNNFKYTNATRDWNIVCHIG